jgi:ribosomal-protein-alanine N-acetyltransferase
VSFINFFRRKLRTEVAPLGSALSSICSDIHKESFARGWTENEFENLLSEQNIIANYIYNIASKKMLGFILSRKAADEAEILSIAIKSKYRGRGMASTLLKEHINDLQNLGIIRLFLEVDKNNQPALRLYEKVGFFQVGERQSYYQSASGEYSTAYILRKDIAL